MDAEKSKQLKAQLELMADKALLRELITHEFTVRHIQQNEKFKEHLTVENFQKMVREREEYIQFIKFEILKRMEAHNA